MQWVRADCEEDVVRLDGRDEGTRRRPLAVALSDFREGLGLYELWLHQGWVDVVRRYRRTRLGPLWHTIGLGAFIAVMGVLWGTLLRAEPISYFRHVTTGLISWSLISGTITAATSLFTANRATALSIRFPFTAFAFAHVWKHVLVFSHHLVLWLLLLVFAGPLLTGATWLAIPGLLFVVVNLAWISLLIGVASLRVPDLGPAVGTIMQVMLFATPVLWSPDLLGPELHQLSQINPLYHLLSVLREPLKGAAPDPSAWVFCAVSAVVGWTATLFVFGAVRHRVTYWY